METAARYEVLTEVLLQVHVPEVLGRVDWTVVTDVS
jgi:hypothetical protein